MSYTKSFTADAVLRRYMIDPAISLRNLLKDSWILGGEVARDQVLFTTEWIDEDYEQPQVTVTPVADRDFPMELGYGTVRVEAIFQVDVWASIQRATGKGPGLARKQRWEMATEVRRILKADHVDVDDVKFMLPEGPGRWTTDREVSPPRLRWTKDVMVIWDY